MDAVKADGNIFIVGRNISLKNFEKIIYFILGPSRSFPHFFLYFDYYHILATACFSDVDSGVGLVGTDQFLVFPRALVRSGMLACRDW